MNGGTGRAVRLAVAALTVLLLTGLAPANAEAQEPSTGFSIVDGRLVDGYGNDFIMRGVNHPHAWFESRMGSLADIKATGANTVRIVLSTGARFSRTSPDAVAELVRRCRTLRLVCVLEVHDTTGYPEVQNSITLDQAVDYWEELLPVVEGTESFVLVNIGNEPFGNESTAQWQSSTEAAIRRLRDIGYQHTFMVDAPNWGQDWSFAMRDGAAHVFASDPHANVIFDVHMYGVFDNPASVRSYLESYVRDQLPLVVGEFGATHTDGDPDERAILHWTAMYGIGTLAWSWSGNTDPVEALNIVEDFDPSRRTAWGHVVLNGSPMVASPPIEASIFGEPVVRPQPLLATAPATPQAIGPRSPAPQLVTRVEAESGLWNGLQPAINTPGFSGAGYLHGSDTFGDSATVTVHVDHAGSYRLVFGYRSPYGDKFQNIIVNGVQHDSVGFAHTETFAAADGPVVALDQGTNSVMIQHDWGWIDLDYIEVWLDA